MICRNCGEDIDTPTVGFKAVCPACDSWLHTCTQCSLFNHLTDRCSSMTTDAVRDRDRLNFCEEFIPCATDHGPSAAKPDSSSGDRFTRLFGGGSD